MEMVFLFWVWIAVMIISAFCIIIQLLIWEVKCLSYRKKERQIARIRHLIGLATDEEVMGTHWSSPQAEEKEERNSICEYRY